VPTSADKQDHDSQSISSAARNALPTLFARSHAFTQLDKLLKQKLDQIPAGTYRVACVRNGELSIFCAHSVWFSRLRLLQNDILQICKQLHQDGSIEHLVHWVKIRVRADPAAHFTVEQTNKR